MNATAIRKSLHCCCLDTVIGSDDDPLSSRTARVIVWFSDQETMKTSECGLCVTIVLVVL